MANLSESEAAHHLLGIRGPSRIHGRTGSRYLPAYGSGEFQRSRLPRPADRTAPSPPITTNCPSTLKWLAQPCLGWPGDWSPSTRSRPPWAGRHRRKRRGQSFRTPGAGDGIEDHQSRHERGEYPPEIPERLGNGLALMAPKRPPDARGFRKHVRMRVPHSFPQFRWDDWPSANPGGNVLLRCLGVGPAGFLSTRPRRSLGVGE